MRRVLPIAVGAFLTAGFFVSNAAAPTFNVTVGPSGQLRYSPDPQTINANDTIHWVWASSTHSTTSGTPGIPDGKWNSGLRSSGATFDHTFTVAGNYPYYCTFAGHADSGMTGTIIVNGPTGVKFSSFSAARTARGVRVSWRTGSELETLGFDVYRERGGKRVRLTRRPIAARGEVLGASYSFVDQAAPRAGRPVYWLRVFEVDGSRTWFGRAIA